MAPLDDDGKPSDGLPASVAPCEQERAALSDVAAVDYDSSDLMDFNLRLGRGDSAASARLGVALGVRGHPQTYAPRDRLMSRRRSLTSQLYRAARLSDTASAIASGNPRRVARRAKNVLVGRALGRAGVWRRLWR
jgi:hypothetical protein